MKYRIVSRNKKPSGEHSNYPWFYAQMEVFGIWVDCRFHPMKESYNSYDANAETVDMWINSQIAENEPMKEEVVKTYD